jgi:uncharacterized protein YfcZ (UPF0381/DUF406 family)
MEAARVKLARMHELYQQQVSDEQSMVDDAHNKLGTILKKYKTQSDRVAHKEEISIALRTTKTRSIRLNRSSKVSESVYSHLTNVQTWINNSELMEGMREVVMVTNSVKMDMGEVDTTINQLDDFHQGKDELEEMFKNLTDVMNTTSSSPAEVNEDFDEELEAMIKCVDDMPDRRNGGEPEKPVTRKSRQSDPPQSNPSPPQSLRVAPEPPSSRRTTEKLNL